MGVGLCCGLGVLGFFLYFSQSTIGKMPTDDCISKLSSWQRVRMPSSTWIMAMPSLSLERHAQLGSHAVVFPETPVAAQDRLSTSSPDVRVKVRVRCFVVRVRVRKL